MFVRGCILKGMNDSWKPPFFIADLPKTYYACFSCNGSGPVRAEIRLRHRGKGSWRSQETTAPRNPFPKEEGIFVD